MADSRQSIDNIIIIHNYIYGQSNDYNIVIESSGNVPDNEETNSKLRLILLTVLV